MGEIMKLSEFRGLCDREWGEARGDVTRLRLTDESYAELAEDALISGAGGESMLLPLGELLNPVTRSVVKVTAGASTDLAEVVRNYAGGGRRASTAASILTSFKRTKG